MYKIDTGATYEQFIMSGRETENLYWFYMELLSIGVEFEWSQGNEGIEFNHVVDQDDLLDCIDENINLYFEDWRLDTVKSVANDFRVDVTYEKL